MKAWNRHLISGIAFNRDEAKLTVLGVPDQPGVAYQILGPIAEANIEVDMIVQNIAPDGATTDFTFTVHRNDYDEGPGDSAKRRQGTECAGRLRAITKSSRSRWSGSGCAPMPASPARCSQALAKEGINIRMISTSEIKISVVVDEKYLELGVRALHDAFNLEHGGNLIRLCLSC